MNNNRKTLRAFTRLALGLLCALPLCSCDCESTAVAPGGGIGFGVEEIVILDPGSGYEVGDDVSFGAALVMGASPIASAFVSEVDAEGGVIGVEITNGGRYLVTPNATIQSAAGAGCVLLPDLRVVKLCLANEFEGNINGSMTLQAAPLGPQAHQLEVSAICFSEPGSDLCTLAVNGSHVIDKSQEIEVSLFTTTLNEFTNNEDHIISSPGEGMVLTHKVDLDGDGEFEIGEGEISFYTWLDGAAALPAATLDQETESFSAGLTSSLGAKLEMSGAVSFTDCD